MEIAFQDWIELLLRWLHLIVGIAWIGSSFYFMWLDASLRKFKNAPPEVFGENWSVHGGGFYQSRKYLVAPKEMPSELHWFKYEAYATWLSGLSLLAVIYYLGAEIYLIDKEKISFEPWQAIMLSLVFLSCGWLLYNLFCKSPIGKNIKFLGALIFFFLVGFSELLSQVFSDRAALLHVGAIIGTIMVGNVFFIIIPNQKKVVRELIRGNIPDQKLGQEAKQRSTHNNYLTLPILLIMISNHYPMLARGDHLWLVVALLLLIGGVIRNFFNVYNAGFRRRKIFWQWPLAVTLIVMLVLVCSYTPLKLDSVSKSIKAEHAMNIIQNHCVSCHAMQPTNDLFDVAGGGVRLGSIDLVRKHSRQILNQAVLSKAMPLGNVTSMTLKERESLGLWIRAGMPD